MTAIQVRYVLHQYLYIYNDNRLEKICNELLNKSDEYLVNNYKAELFKIYRKFENPLMETIYQAVFDGNLKEIFMLGYLETLDHEVQSLLK